MSNFIEDTLHGYSAINCSSIPVGTIIPYAGKITAKETDYAIDVFKQGWLICDGSEYITIEYPVLFAALGYLYGGKDEKFKVPDLRGQFLRGVGDDAASKENRTKPGDGDIDGVGSSQPCAVQTHIHVFFKPGAFSAKPGKIPISNTTPPPPPYPNTDVIKQPLEKLKHENVNISDKETRPTNVFVNFLIKFRY